MDFLPGCHADVADLLKIFGLNPGQCRHAALILDPKTVVTLKIELMPTKEQLQEVKRVLLPNAKRVAIENTPFGTTHTEFTIVDADAPVPEIRSFIPE